MFFEAYLLLNMKWNDDAIELLSHINTYRDINININFPYF